MTEYLPIHEIRRRRLRQILDESGERQLTLAERAGTNPSVISAILSNATAKAKMGDDLARRLEAAGGKPAGWMDTLDEIQMYADILERVLGQIPPAAWNPLTRRLAVRAAQVALREGWSGETLEEKVKEYLRLAS